MDSDQNDGALPSERRVAPRRDRIRTKVPRLARKEPIASGELSTSRPAWVSFLCSRQSRPHMGAMTCFLNGKASHPAVSYCPWSAGDGPLRPLTGVMVPNSPLTSWLGPAAKYTVSELELRPPPSVRVHKPSIARGLPFASSS